MWRTVGGFIKRKEGNVLFNDTLNTFYLRLYGVGHMVKDHSDSKRGNPLPPHGLLFPISSKGSFMCIIPQTGQHIPQAHRTMSENSYHMSVRYIRNSPDRITHTTVFVTPVVEHWLERETAQWVHPMNDRSDDPSHHERTLLPRSYLHLATREFRGIREYQYICNWSSGSKTQIYRKRFTAR